MVQRGVRSVAVMVAVLATSCGGDHGEDLRLLNPESFEAPSSVGPKSSTTAAPAAVPDSTTSGEGPTTAVAPFDPVPESRPCRGADELAGVAAPATVGLGALPRPAASPTVLERVETDQPHLALTFDAEQDPAAVTPLLEVLANHQVRTTFFVDGMWAEANPALVAAIAAGGHEIGNHGFSHQRMAEWEADDVRAELERAEAVLTGLGVAPTAPWLRPPFGNVSEVSLAAAFEAGWTSVRWSGGSDDTVTGTPEEVEDAICAALLDAAERGAILISHTYNERTPAAVDRFVGEIHDAGFVIVPLSVLAAEDPGSLMVP